MRSVPITHYNHTDPQAEHIDPAVVTPTGNAEPTSRILEGSSDHGFSQEWAEPALLPDGRRCFRMYLFSDDDVHKGGEPLLEEEYPWDDDHVRRIKLTD